jgi:hypothetical protein
MLEGDVTVGFEDLPLTVPPLQEYAGPGGGVYYDGSDEAGGFESGGVYFGNSYNTAWMSWSGWAYSTTADMETTGYTNGYSSVSGTAASGDVYGVVYYSAYDPVPEIHLLAGLRTPQAIKLNNNTYTFYALRDGSYPATAFTTGDYFKIILTSFTDEDEQLGQVEFFLADFREETEPDYIVDEWDTVDLSPLNGGTIGQVAKIQISFESTDIGDYGINTPTYAVVDDLIIRGSWGGYLAQPDGWVDTGEFLGRVYPVGDFVWIEALGKWIYLPAAQMASGTGAWMYLPE